ncbi:MAG TPA: homoserine kinase [Blastocatellia bacterium]|nr:homoserine kinase [Blastocatellia bacterium]
MTTIRVPASTSNLGPGFDSHGLALSLYLTLEVEPTENPYGTFTFEGEGAEELRTAAEDNIIFSAMRFAADREGIALQPARIHVANEIPLARGLGSSGAAIIAGLSAFEVISGVELTTAKLLSYATEIEGHSDNVAAALLGSFVVSCVTEAGEVLAAPVRWPAEVRALVAVPDFKVKTEHARGVLPATLSLQDAVFNIQRASLMVAAVSGKHFGLMREAARDRVHQPHRAPLVPGLNEVLALADEGSAPDLLAVALSGSGPTVVVFAAKGLDGIGRLVERCFERHGIRSEIRVLDIETQGRVVD